MAPAEQGIKTPGSLERSSVLTDGSKEEPVSVSSSCYFLLLILLNEFNKSLYHVYCTLGTIKIVTQEFYMLLYCLYFIYEQTETQRS